MMQVPSDENSTSAIALIYLTFAEREAHGRSALYETLARGVAGDSVARFFVAAFPRAKPQPNLLFARVNPALNQRVWSSSLQRPTKKPQQIRHYSESLF